MEVAEETRAMYEDRNRSEDEVTGHSWIWLVATVVILATLSNLVS